MSAERNGQHAEVVDDEGRIDTKIKQRILDARERIDERADLLFTEALVNPEMDINYERAVAAWGDTVRQFLVSIEPLLASDEIENAEQYYRQAELGEVTLTPPDKDGYQFSLFANDRFDDEVLKRRLGLPKTADPPKPVTVEFQGLIQVIVRNQLEHSWTVCVDDSGVPPEHEYLSLHTMKPVPQHILRDSVRAADRFLQEEAGVGLEIGADPHGIT